MNITVDVNLWFLISLCLFCILAGLIYGVSAKRRLERDRPRPLDLDQIRQYERERRY